MSRDEEIRRIIILKYQAMKLLLESCKEKLERKFDEIDELKAELMALNHGETDTATKDIAAGG